MIPAIEMYKWAGGGLESLKIIRKGMKEKETSDYGNIKDGVIRYKAFSQQTEEDDCTITKVRAKTDILAFAWWLRTKCMVSRNGWISSSVPRKWEGEKTNEQAYEMYLESLKDEL